MKQEDIQLSNLTEELKKTQVLEMYNFFFNAANQALIITDNDLNIIDMNNSACELLDISLEFGVNRTLFDFLTYVSNEDIQRHLTLIQEGKGHVGELLLNNHSGNFVYVKYDVIYNDEAYFFTFMDVTIFKKNEKDYTISTQMFQDLFSKTTDGILTLDQDGQVLDVNEAFLAKIGLEKDLFIGSQFTDFLSISARRNWEKSWEALLEVEKVSGIVELLIEGRSYFFEYNMYLNKYNYQLITVFKDITEKTLIKQELKKREEMFTHIVGEAIDGIILSDDQGIILEANRSAGKIFEIRKEKLVGKELFSFISEKDERFQSVKKKLLQTGAVRDELFFIMANGQKKYLEFTIKKVEETNLHVTIVRNVTERHEMELKLRNSENHFRKIFEELTEGLILWKDDYIIDINEVGANIISCPKRKIQSVTIGQVLDQIPESRQAMENMLRKIERQDVEETLPIKFRDGTIKYIEFSTKRNLLNDMNLTVFKDVTEKLKLQEQLRKSDTLSVVGELAAGIAHEIRNPMTALKGFIQLLESSVKEDFSDYFSIITSELKRIDTIVTEFLFLAKPQVIHHEEKNINVIVKETVDLLVGESSLHNIIIHTILSEETLYLYCEPNQLKQVFINILKNAFESMSDGGIITIQTERHEEEYVKVSIADVGVGIPKEKLKKLGEPFYTTKDRGTGLGLMVTYKIIEEHNGWIEVESEVGVGTVFTVYLPLLHSKNE
ncbi:MAG: PAS domain S-box protein [Bacillus sp. (in: firmicutes)]